MDGMLEDIVVDAYCTTDMDAARAVAAAHARRMAREARAIGASCAPAFTLDPSEVRRLATAAAIAAEQHHRSTARHRAFQADRLRGLREAGRISGPQYRAAVEIADLIQWFDAGKQVLARTQFAERLPASTGTLTLRQHLEEAERLRYGPWRAWAGAYPVKADGSMTLEHLARAFVVQGLGVRQAAQAFRMDQRRAEALLARALRKYAAIAGWEAMGESA